MNNANILLRVAAFIWRCIRNALAAIGFLVVMLVTLWILQMMEARALREAAPAPQEAFPLAFEAASPRAPR